MTDTFTSEAFVRLAAFSTVFAGLAALELAAPVRRASRLRGTRWLGNLGLLLVDTLLVRLVFPAAAVGVALWAESRGWGLFNAFAVSAFVTVPLTVVLLDLAIYLQHVAFHKVPGLWPLHRVHHTDTEIDVTTGLRFHPLEILLSMALKGAVVIALGAPPLGVLIFEIVLNAGSMFSHANIRLPARIEPALRWLIVTPAMHHIHHSAERAETDSNYGFNLSWWDRLFGTYRGASRGGEDFLIGLEELRTPRDSRIDQLLLQPWRKADRTEGREL